MALNEQELSRRLVEARYAESTGTDTVTIPIAEHIADMQAHLDTLHQQRNEQQEHRRQMGRMADLVEAAGVVTK